MISDPPPATYSLFLAKSPESDTFSFSVRPDD